MVQLIELFKPIKNFEGLYEISNYGNVKSLERECQMPLGGVYHKPEIILKPGTYTSGYRFVTLSKDGKEKPYAINLLVYDHFGDRNRNQNNLQVDHIDNNKLNDRIDNLQLLSCRENLAKYYKTQKKSSKFIGVYWQKKSKKWCTRIFINGKRKFLGYFNDEHVAHLAYQKALTSIEIKL